jgi:hypothetical protein
VDACASVILTPLEPKLNVRLNCDLLMLFCTYYVQIISVATFLSFVQNKLRFCLCDSDTFLSVHPCDRYQCIVGN